MKNNIVTRIAPSPTGEMHIGTIRTALFNYLFAKQHGGTYFVRIEDTDRERNKPEWVEAIWRDFEWCGLMPDKKYVQSEHLDRHIELLKSLVESGKAYVSKEPAKDDPSKEVEVIRLKNPGKEITFNDLVRGEITFDTTDLGDFVIARSLDDPLYHFVVVADDADAGVTHVIRAEEHISNTPRQILIQEALGFDRPVYAHIPLILAQDRSKLSKRTHSASVEQYRSKGYFPEAVINYLALLGWNPGTEEELFSLDELIERFSFDQVQKGGAIFDETKLRWFNQQYLKQKPFEEIRELLKAQDLPSNLQKIFDENDDAIRDLVERIEIPADVRELAQNGEFSYYTEQPTYNTEDVIWKKSDKATAIKHLEKLVELLENCSHFSADEVKECVWEYASEEGRGDVLWPMRFALSGKDKSPDPFTLASILGKDETLERLHVAVKKLQP